MRIYLQKPAIDDQPQRFCQVVLQADLLGGWNVVIESGVQGGSGRVRKQHFEVRTEAEEAVQAARDAQLRRGFRVMFVQGDGRQPHA